MYEEPKRRQASPAPVRADRVGAGPTPATTRAPAAGGLAQLQRNLQASPAVQSLQAAGARLNASPSPAEAPANHTGLPDGLKAGLESLSGVAMDDVRVHFNSSRPAQLQARAFAQGKDIHVAPGEERHLPHEAWHVVQQKQKRVRETGRLGGVPLNTDPSLEREADVMGARAQQVHATPKGARTPPMIAAPSTAPAQRIPIGWDAKQKKFHVWKNRNAQETSVVFGAARDNFRLGLQATPDLAAQVEAEWADLDKNPWVFVQGENPGSGHVAWRGDPKLAARPAVPTIWKEFKVSPANVPPGTAVLDEVNYALSKKGSGPRATGDQYNPFGRFATAKHSSFIPAHLTSAAYDQIDEHLKAKDATYISPKALKHGLADAGSAGYPATLTTADGVVLYLDRTDSQFGAHYFSDKPSHAVAAADPKAAKAAPLVNGPKSDPMVAPMNLTKTTVQAWSGAERSEQQRTVMGCSAGEVALAAGFPEEDWEWLHLVAHGMGGIEGVGPQTAGNLVAGTHEANSAMIIAEEFLKDMIVRLDATAVLTVLVQMHDKNLRIGSVIRYHAKLTYAGGKDVVYAWTFNCLSRSQPQASKNRQIRYHGRARTGVLGEDPSGKSAHEMVDTRVPARSPKEQITGELENARNMRAKDRLAVIKDACQHVARTIPTDLKAVLDAVAVVPAELRQAFMLEVVRYHPNKAFLDALNTWVGTHAKVIAPAVADAIAKSLTFVQGSAPLSKATGGGSAGSAASSGGSVGSASSSVARRETTRSGNCLFEAVNILLGNDASLDGWLREQCTDYFVEHPGLAQLAGVTADAVVATLVTPGAWAGNAGDLSPAILASVVRRNFRIVTAAGVAYDVESAEPTVGAPLLLYLADNHYTVNPVGPGHLKVSAVAVLSVKSHVQSIDAKLAAEAATKKAAEAAATAAAAAAAVAAVADPAASGSAGRKKGKAKKAVAKPKAVAMSMGSAGAGAKPVTTTVALKNAAKKSKAELDKEAAAKLRRKPGDGGGSGGGPSGGPPAGGSGMDIRD